MRFSAYTLALALAACRAWGQQSVEPPVVPEDLQPGAGYSILGRGLGVGAQVYTCQENAGKTAFTWVLKAPDATLFDGYAQMLAKHFAGPTWMFKDGSRIVAEKVKEAPAANPKSIPWLLLKVSQSGSGGPYSRTAFIQRVNTAGGLAPEGGCGPSTAGAETRVDYQAMYYFWGKSQ